ncbi:WD40 repeat domain-containing protein [Microbispora bryophytorum]|uniref:WD40 repeat domain-containing protein n=1 Tax=Microbispora bryophytorum TaxID=1460882 RepID=UPI00371064D6
MPEPELRVLSSLDKLFALERQFAPGPSPETTISVEECCRQLIDEGLWWDACSDAVRTQPGRLHSWIKDGCWALDAIDDADTADAAGTIVDGLGIAASGAWHVAAMAWLASDGKRQPDERLDGALTAAVDRWRNSHLLPRHGISSIPTPDNACNSRIMERLDGLGGGLARSMVALEIETLTASTGWRLRRDHWIKVLFDAGDAGLVGTLSLGVLRGGPPGLFPDPRTMFDFQADHSFQDAITTVWKRQSDGWADMPCLLWRLSIDDARVRRVSGASLGAAFAVLLEEVLGPPRRRAFIAFTGARAERALGRWFRTPRVRQAVTGCVEPTGRLGKVGGMAAKLERAGQSALNVVAPEANRQSDGHLAHGVQIAWAADVASARRHLYRLAPRRVGILAVVIVTMLVVVVSLIVLRGDRSAAEARTLSATIMNRSHTVWQSDPFISGLLATAAWQTHPSNEARQGMLNFLATTAQTVMPMSNVGSFSPDGNTLATIGAGNTIEVWDVPARKRRGTLRDGHTGAVWNTLFSPDGKVMASVGQDHTVRLWDVASLKPIIEPIMPVPRISDPNGRIQTIAFSPDGELIAVATLDNRIRLYEVATGRRTGAPIRTPMLDLKRMLFGPDTRTIFVVADRSVQVWTSTTGWHVPANLGKVDSLTLQGDTLVTHHDDEVQFWQASSLRPLGTPIRTGPIEKLAVSPNGTTLATSSDRSIQYWDLKTRRRTGTTVIGHTDDIMSMGFTTDGARLWTTAGDGTGRVWNTAALARIGDPITVTNADTAYEHYPVVRSFSTDGISLIVAAEGVLQQWTTRGKRGQDLPAGALAVSPDGRTVATVEDAELVLRERATGRRTGTPLPLPDETRRDIAFSPDWRSVAIADENDIQVWNLTTGRPLSPVLTGHGEDFTGYDPDNTVVTGPIDGIRDMTFSPDGTTLISAGIDGVLRFWDITTGRSVRGGESEDVVTVEIDKSGRHAVTLGIDPTDERFGIIRLWDLASRKPIGTPWKAHARSADAAAFSPDGRMLATAGSDGEIRLWDVSTRRPLGNPIKAHRGDVTSLVFSPDGKALASAGGDGTVQLWATGFPDNPQKAVCAVAARPLTKEEWQRHLPETAAPENLGCSPG